MNHGADFSLWTILGSLQHEAGRPYKVKIDDSLTIDIGATRDSTKPSLHLYQLGAFVYYSPAAKVHVCRHLKTQVVSM
jgi:hypothetical protein